MRNTILFRTEIWRRKKTEKVENLEMSTVGRAYGKKTEKSWKMRNIHLTTLKMTQITKKREK